MLRVRLQRVGRRNDPSFRIVVTEKTRGPKSGKYIEMLGSYNPRQKHVSIKGDRIKYWLSKGAQASDTVHNILVGQKLLEGKKINVLPRKQPIVKEKAEETQQEAAGSDNSNKETPLTESDDKTPDDSASEEEKGEEKSEVSNESETSPVSAETTPSDQPASQSVEKKSAEKEEKSG